MIKFEKIQQAHEYCNKNVNFLVVIVFVKLVYIHYGSI